MQLLQHAVMYSGICIPGIPAMSGGPGAKAVPVLVPSYLIGDDRSDDSLQSVKVTSVWFLSGGNLAMDAYAMFQPVLCDGGADVVYNRMLV